jgi:hypothetical protein
MAHRQALAITTLAASVWLSACQERAAAPPAAIVPAPASEAAPAPATAPAAPAAVAPPPAPARYAVTIKGRIHPDLPESRFTLLADGAPQETGVLHVRTIEIRRTDTADPAQRIDGLATDTPWSVSAPGFELLDMNFDGYADMRMIESRPAGPNLPYLNWLYDPTNSQFVASPVLNTIPAARFDAAAREVHSEWRDSASRYGRDTYAFRDGQLVPLRREEKNYRQAGVFTLRISRWADGAWRAVETRDGRDP